MKRFALPLLSVSIMAMMPVIAGAAGTYYNGNLYQNPQRYGSTGGGYYNSYGAGRGYGQSQSVMVRNTTTRVTKKTSSKQKQSNLKQGLQIDASLSHEFANWDLEMKKAGSKLRYDGLAWNVISGEGVYYFNTETPMQINFGASYGKQSGKTSMIDDDISNGAYGYQDWYEGRQVGYAMSIGTSEGGSQTGFYVGFGLTDFAKLGSLKITPSIGYRYFKYDLTTKKNSGLTMDVFMGNAEHAANFVNCISVGGETQCDPFVLFEFFDASGASLGTAVTGREQREDGSLTDIVFYGIPGNASAVTVSLGDTYYYSQGGTSHKYETEWAGPYVALDMEYAINDKNLIDMGVEFGLPVYDSKGDQPYRIDWSHPTSVEDKGKFGDAYHLGLNAMWSTAIADNTMFTLGLTYDYYQINGADATTYLNSSYYQTMLDKYVTYIDENYDTLVANGELAIYQNEVETLNKYKSDGWKMESKDEIKSIYSSMGIRAGISVKF